ncbi:SMI1/KNR4 family protein [Ornithinimicrobium sp. Y1694]|uniref:SMI1/KNR4 family protein n=1 Tax=Ornithinimicrobium sp. Y1694 TaxID=3418590 RepID=UPI003CE99BEE
MSRPTIPALLAAWRLAPDHVQLSDGASPDSLSAAERELGVDLPEELKELYLSTDGVTLDRGDLTLFTARGSEEELGLSDATATYRAWDWGLPEQVVLIGSDGGDSVFGVWSGKGAARAIVVQGEVSLGDPAMAVVGTSLAGFLAAWTAYYLPMVHGMNAQVLAVLDALQVPEALREGESEFDDEHVQALLAWGSADLPDDEPDPYARPVSVAELEALATTSP